MNNFIYQTKACSLIILFLIVTKHGLAKTDPVRGVWITNVASNALDSPENIREAVRICEESGINNIFVVTWNRARTLYPSAIMKEKFGIPIMERFNGRDPLKEIILEAHAHNIKDRLPAVPSEAGYDKYTVGLYQSQHNGQSPPTDYTDKDWINWRADLLTQYLGNLYKKLKKLRPELIVSMAPSIYPWGKEKYLQDLPAWMAKGYVDYLFPQVYRYNFNAYSTTLKDQANELKELEKERVFPGVLLQVNGKNPTAGFLDSMIVENRRIGFKGECFSFYEGLKKFPEFFENYKNR